MEFTLAFLSASVTPRCGTLNQCGPSGHVDYAYITLGIVLSAGDETIFYQVILADTRNRVACPANDPCEAFEYWFEDTLPTLGYSESIANSFDVSCLQPGTQQSYLLPILPRLKYAVAYAAEHFGSTADLASWYITGVYLGPGMEGSAVVSVRMSGLDLNYN